MGYFSEFHIELRRAGMELLPINPPDDYYGDGDYDGDDRTCADDGERIEHNPFANLADSDEPQEDLPF